MATFNEYVKAETGMDIETLRNQGMTPEMEAKLQEEYSNSVVSAN